MNPTHVTSSEACRILGIAPETLYAYVSRGLVRSEPGSEPRVRLYPRSDIEALRRRQDLRRSPQQVLRKSLDWGAPILDSGLTLIADGRLYYRGRDAVQLAAEAGFEAAAAHLWTGATSDPLPQSVPLPASNRRAHKQASDPLSEFQMRLPSLAESDPAAGARDAHLQLRTAVRVVLALASVVSESEVRSLDRVAQAVARKWRRQDSRDRRLIEQALILCMDHELNISSFTARCAASAGSNLYDSVNAALSAFRGFRHGGSTTKVERLLDDIGGRRNLRGALAARLRRGEDIPGFGHPLYPGGDPRAAFILSALRDRCARNPELRSADRAAQAVEETLGRRPNLDFALVALRRTLGAPSGSGMVLFALGRAVGWTAHAMEQSQIGSLIRPRARYTGPAPET